MVRITLISVALAALVTFSTADPLCTDGIVYCGSSLLEIGDYLSEIDAALIDQALPVNDLFRANSIFNCFGRRGISYLTTCDTCNEPGRGFRRERSGYCREPLEG